MAKNKLSDLNDHLFLSLERLNDENLAEENIDNEWKKADAICMVAGKIIDNHKLVIDAMRLASNGHFNKEELPDTFGIRKLEN
jgi:hypothetical protein